MYLNTQHFNLAKIPEFNGRKQQQERERKKKETNVALLNLLAVAQDLARHHPTNNALLRNFRLSSDVYKFC